MREVATFMGMYPSYQLRDVLDEYAVCFFSLLNQGYRLRHEKYLMLANIVSVPHMDEGARVNFIRNLEWAAKHPSELLKRDDDGSDTDQLQNMLG